MKPNEYIKKYNIQSGWSTKHQKSFLEDFTAEFKNLLELHKAQGNIYGFNNAVKELRSKWDGISAKICFGLPDGMWNFFFATVVSQLRDELCPNAYPPKK